MLESLEVSCAEADGLTSWEAGMTGQSGQACLVKVEGEDKGFTGRG